jgi:uncharacterized protein YndB with AHSA1/START domain
MTRHQPEDLYGALIEPTTLTIQRWLPGPVERIWNYLVDGDMRRRWLASGVLPEHVGQGFELTWRNDTLSRDDDPRPEGFGAEQNMRSELLAIVPMQHLAIAWGTGKVVFDLAPKGDRVLLTLTHSGLGDTATLVMIGAGWHMHLDILLALAEGREPGSFWSGWQELKADYRARLS